MSRKYTPLRHKVQRIQERMDGSGNWYFIVDMASGSRFTAVMVATAGGDASDDEIQDGLLEIIERVREKGEANGR